MHELPVVETILSTVLRHAAMHGAIGIKTIYLQVGALSDLEDEWMQQFFDYAAKESLAAGATLEIERTPIGLSCKSCGHSYSVDLRDQIESPCPECGAGDSRIVSGHDYLITNMEIMLPGQE